MTRAGSTTDSSPTGQSTAYDNGRTVTLSIERAGDPSVFGEDVRAAALELAGRYPGGNIRSALLPMLHLVQSEQGCITPDGIAFCAETLGLTKAQVSAVATFYTMYKRRPTGEYLVSVCTNTLCGMLGGDEIYATLSDTLGVGMNETTEDGSITLEHAECLAGCDYAPVVTVNYEFFDNQTVESARALVARLRAGERPRPTRGAPLCSFREISRQIAGLGDPRPEALDADAVGEPTTAGVRLAMERGDSAPSYALQDGSADPVDVPEQSPRPNSANDAPLSTAETDPANSALPAGQKGTGPDAANGIPSESPPAESEA